jgi:copper chaperone CopZ
VRVSLKSVSGVDSADVSLAKGLAAVKMKPGNTTTLKQLNEAITKNGFTMKDSAAVVVGVVASEGDKMMLHVTGSSDLLVLVPQSGKPDTASIGKTVSVEGTIPEGTKGKTADTIRYQSMTEEK